MKTILVFSFILVSLSSIAQLYTYPGNVGFILNPSFLGPNYHLSNVQFTGNPLAVGSFISDSTNLGLTKGVILTTGGIWSDEGPQGPNDKHNAAIDNGAYGSSFIPNSYNAAILEFDLYSFVDTVEFRYVFGSEEYPDFQTQFEDEFMILIEGPGILGIQQINYLANNVPVGLNTVNALINSALFVSNGTGYNAPHNESEYYIQYDGFTVPLTAKAAVQAGQTYHITIIVADVFDAIFDSGVFIEQCESCNYNASVPHMSLDQIESYPNPSNGNLTLQFPELTSDAELKIINELGELVRREAIKSGSNEFSITDLSRGGYIITIISESEHWNGKLIVK